MKINDLPMTFRRRVYGAVTVILKTTRTWSVIVSRVFLNGRCLPFLSVPKSSSGRCFLSCFPFLFLLEPVVKVPLMYRP